MLGLLLNHLLPYLGGGPDADFLRGLFARYPLNTNPVATRDLPPWRGQANPAAVQEKIIGENTLRDVRLLELALEASRAVVRIITADSLGSGFLVGEGLIMTNHQLIGRREAAQPVAQGGLPHQDKGGQRLAVHLIGNERAKLLKSVEGAVGAPHQ